MTLSWALIIPQLSYLYNIRQGSYSPTVFPMSEQLPSRHSNSLPGPMENLATTEMWTCMLLVSHL